MMLNRKKFLLALFFFNIAYAQPVSKLKIGWQEAVAPIPDNCIELKGIAEANFSKGKYSTFEKGIDVEYLSRPNNLSKNRVYYPVPIDSYIVFFLRPQLNMRFSSMFINCENRKVYISESGEPGTSASWYGPYSL